MAREMTQAELADLLRTTERAAKPAPPVSMRAAVERGAVAGFGAVLALGGLLYWQQAPLDTLVNAPVVTGVVIAGVIMLVSAFPTEKIAPALLTARRIQQVQATVTAAELRKQKDYEAMVGIEAEAAAWIAELEKALVELRNENKVLRSEKAIIANQVQNPHWTPRSKVDPVTHKHAATILQHWFATLRADTKGDVRGEWWSRPKATAAGWTKTEHAEAAQLLEDAELTGQNGLLPFVLPDVRDLADALHRLDAYCREVEQEPYMPRPYVELNTDN